ncbi:MAG: cytidine deaminase [Lachnospiraceae bacterium]|nr:cytidine deaminase [Lachnospiraceae bacterium]
MSNTLDNGKYKCLISAALEAREKAYAPYSKFKVGAALLTSDENVITGCNVENASYPACNCAERTAVFKAISMDKKSFEAIAIIAGKENDGIKDYTSPCGVCRQVLREFVDPCRFKVIMAKSMDDYKIATLEELLPLSFGPENLE